MMSRRALILRTFRIAAAAAAMVVFAPPLRLAVAASLDEAKAAGHVGERPDGYLGVVSSSAPADVRDLVERINAQRRQKYAEVAARTGAGVREVAIVAGQKLIGGTAAGNYYMNAQGQWVRR